MSTQSKPLDTEDTTRDELLAKGDRYWIARPLMAFGNWLLHPSFLQFLMLAFLVYIGPHTYEIILSLLEPKEMSVWMKKGSAAAGALVIEYFMVAVVFHPSRNAKWDDKEHYGFGVLIALVSSVFFGVWEPGEVFTALRFKAVLFAGLMGLIGFKLPKRLHHRLLEHRLRTVTEARFAQQWADLLTYLKADLVPTLTDRFPTSLDWLPKGTDWDRKEDDPQAIATDLLAVAEAESRILKEKEDLIAFMDNELAKLGEQLEDAKAEPEFVCPHCKTYTATSKSALRDHAASCLHNPNAWHKLEDPGKEWKHEAFVREEILPLLRKANLLTPTNGVSHTADSE